jgi:hypothetical protein
LGGALVLGSACDSSDDSVQPLSKKDAGNVEGGGGADSATDGQVNPNTICYRAGGFSKVQAMSLALYKAVSADCRIGAYFNQLALTDQTHFTECFAKQLGEMMGCDGVVYTGSIDSLQSPCRPLAEAHQAIDPQISTADFDVFVGDATNVLRQQGLGGQDLTNVVSLLNGTRGPVQQNADNAFAQSTCDGGPIEAGSDGGEGGSDAGSDTSVADADDAG